jgi:NTE family protein
VRIDGELYWDGGILSNTPIEVIFDDKPRRNSLIFAVHLWNPIGRELESMWEVMSRQKDVQYSSRIASQITHQVQVHRLRHVINELLEYIPDNVRDSEDVRELAGWACPTLMHVVRLLARPIENEDHTKDVDFSASGISQRWDAGYDCTRRVIEQKPWQGEHDPLDGVILHELPDDTGVEHASSRLVAAGKSSVDVGPSRSTLDVGRPVRRANMHRV